MRILKYIFLLIVLVMVAVTVFVATQKGEYDISGSRVIKSQRNIIYNYVNDLQNWENWNSLKTDDPEIKVRYSGSGIGKGSAVEWTGTDGDGSIRTIYTKEGDSIAQAMAFNDAASTVSWSFKDTVGGTKVTWRAKGRLDFVSKIFAAVKGGTENVIGQMYESSLANLDRTLDYEINTFTIKTHGIVTRPETIYLQQTINSKISNAQKNMQIMLSKLQQFFTKNKIPTNGKPFVIYHSYDTASGITKFSVCIPLKEEIYTSQGSDMLFGRLQPMRAAKVTLNGDYSHRNEAWQKAQQILVENNLSRISGIRAVEVLTRNVSDIKSPSKWVTEIYVPVSTPTEEKPVVRTQRRISVPTVRPTVPAEVPTPSSQP